ncbi:hypothetical protein M8J76_010181 [Diaphorina citri]|nr:hypothetical protein M8J76_010181 [Diaphorina citri]
MGSFLLGLLICAVLTLTSCTRQPSINIGGFEITHNRVAGNGWNVRPFRITGPNGFVWEQSISKPTPPSLTPELDKYVWCPECFLTQIYGKPTGKYEGPSSDAPIAVVNGFKVWNNRVVGHGWDVQEKVITGPGGFYWEPTPEKPAPPSLPPKLNKLVWCSGCLLTNVYSKPTWSYYYGDAFPQTQNTERKGSITKKGQKKSRSYGDAFPQTPKTERKGSITKKGQKESTGSFKMPPPFPYQQVSPWQQPYMAPFFPPQMQPFPFTRMSPFGHNGMPTFTPYDMPPGYFENSMGPLTNRPILDDMLTSTPSDMPPRFFQNSMGPLIDRPILDDMLTSTPSDMLPRFFQNSMGPRTSWEMPPPFFQNSMGPLNPRPILEDMPPFYQIGMPFYPPYKMSLFSANPNFGGVSLPPQINKFQTSPSKSKPSEATSEFVTKELESPEVMMTEKNLEKLDKDLKRLINEISEHFKNILNSIEKHPHEPVDKHEQAKPDVTSQKYNKHEDMTNGKQEIPKKLQPKPQTEKILEQKPSLLDNLEENIKQLNPPNDPVQKYQKPSNQISEPDEKQKELTNGEQTIPNTLEPEPEAKKDIHAKNPNALDNLEPKKEPLNSVDDLAQNDKTSNGQMPELNEKQTDLKNSEQTILNTSEPEPQGQENEAPEKEEPIVKEDKIEDDNKTEEEDNKLEDPKPGQEGKKLEDPKPEEEDNKLEDLKPGQEGKELEHPKPGQEDNKLGDPKPGQEGKELEDPKPEVEDNKLEDPKSGQEGKELEDPKPGQEEKKLEDPKPGQEGKKLEDPKPEEEDNKLEDPKPGQEEKKLEDPKPGQEGKKLEDPKPGQEEKKLGDPKPGQEGKELEDPKSEEEDNKLEDPKPGQEEKKLEDPKPGQEEKKLEDPKPEEEDNKLEDPKSGQEVKELEDPKPEKEDNKLEDPKPEEEGKELEDPKPEDQGRHGTIRPIHFIENKGTIANPRKTRFQIIDKTGNRISFVVGDKAIVRGKEYQKDDKNIREVFKNNIMKELSQNGRSVPFTSPAPVRPAASCDGIKGKFEDTIDFTNKFHRIYDDDECYLSEVTPDTVHIRTLDKENADIYEEKYTLGIDGKLIYQSINGGVVCNEQLKPKVPNPV